MTVATLNPTSDRPALWKRLLGSELWVLYLVVLYFAAVLPFAPRLGSAENLRNVFSNMLPLLVVAAGQTVVLITGGIDLSVTSIIGLASVAGASVITADGGLLPGGGAGIAAAIAVMVTAGIAVGAFNGVAVTRLRMPPFIVTLTTMMFVSGLAVWATKSRPIYNLPREFNALGKGIWAVAIAGTVALAIHVLLGRALPGRWIYAVGMNLSAARISGIPVNGVILSAYVLSGACASVASLLYTARLETGSPVLGQRILLDVIGATVIGGTSLFGGKGKILWTVFGVALICVIDNTLNMLGLSYFVVMMVKGGVILGAALLDAARTRLLN